MLNTDSCESDCPKCGSECETHSTAKGERTHLHIVEGGAHIWDDDNEMIRTEDGDA